MKSKIIKLIKDAKNSGIEDSEVLLLNSLINKMQDIHIDFETEYQLQEFREVQSQYFDEGGKAYTGTIFGLEMCERMLKLINQLEQELIH